MAEKVSVSQSIKQEDFRLVAESIADELKGRQKRREDTEKHWAEIDRQLRMEPEVSHKKTAGGKIDENRKWMPEVELPLQAQSLELLLSDVRRLRFPKNQMFFQARAALTEKYLRRWNNAGSPFPGERKGDDPNSEINQDNADRLAAGLLSHWHAQYDFRSHVDLIDAQAIAYGFGAGRLKRVKRKILGYDARSTGPADQKIPVLIPRDTKKVYLDDSQHALMHEGHSLGPNIIQTRTMKLADLQAAAKAGGSDPKSEEGGYIGSEIKRLTPDKHGNVELAELEGDLVIERDSEAVIEQNVIATIAMGSGNNSVALVRVREGEPFSSYLVHQYHLEGPQFVQGASPLMKGMPIARTAAQAMNRVIESGLLKTQPPVGYDRDDAYFAANGGPVVYPGAQWPTTENLNVQDLGGDPSVLFEIFSGLVQLYADVTGVTPPRLGAQTKSHTTAFAKDVELQQGAVRTVDYVNSTLEGPMTRLLQLEYRMGLSELRGRQTIFIEPWNEFVSITKQHLPDIVRFLAIGSGAPGEDQARMQERLASAQTALQIDQLAVQLGRQPKIEHGELVEHILSEGGWTDVSAIVRAEGATEGPESQSGMGGAAGVPGVLSQGNPALEGLG